MEYFDVGREPRPGGRNAARLDRVPAAGRRDVLILGCGISALVAARLLARQGLTVTILDHYPAAGGNHISVTAGEMVFDIGAIHFTAQDDFFAVFPEMRAACVERRLTTQKVGSDLTIGRFPMETSDFTRLPLKVKLAVAFSLLRGRLRRGRPVDAADFVERLVGRAFFERSGLKRYMERLFGISPELIEREFCERRLGWLVRRMSLRANALRILHRLRRSRAQSSLAAAAPPTSYVRAPQGFAHYYETALAALAEDGVNVHLGVAMTRIGCVGGRMQIETDQGSFSAERLVSTMPIAFVSKLAGLVPPRIEGVDLLSLFVAFTGGRRFTGTVLYNFHEDGGWKRMTVFSDIYGTKSGEGYLTVEVPCRRGEGDAAAAYERFRDHAARARLFDGVIRLVDSHRLADAYPLLVKGCGKRREEALRRLREAGIEGLGRHGTFDYIPHQTVACRDARAFVDLKRQHRTTSQAESLSPA